MLRLCLCAAALALTGCAADPPRPAGADRPDGLLVLAVLSPERLLVADPRTGETREREMPGGTFCHGPVLAAGDRVVYAGLRGGEPVALTLGLDLRGRGRPLAAGDPIGTLFAGPDPRLPRWSVVEGIVDGGLLFRDDHGLALWRGTARVRVRDGWPLAAGASRFAWCRGDDLCREAGVWSPDGTHALDPPPGVQARLGGRGAFSPDGGRLALPVQARGRDRVAVVDLASGHWELGARLAGYRAVAWSPSGRWVYSTGRRRVIAWAPGERPPRALPIRTGGTVMSIAATG